MSDIIELKSLVVNKGNAAITFDQEEEGNIAIELHMPGYSPGDYISNACIFADVIARMVRDQDSGLMKAFQDYIAKTEYAEKKDNN